MKNFIVLLTVIMFSCASPQKNFEKGNFRKAYNGALSELEDGKRGKNKSILNRAFNEMLKSHQTNYNLIMRDADIYAWENAFSKREQLIVDYLKGERWLNDDFDSPLNELSIENENLSIDIATEFELMGNNAMAVYSRNGDKLAAQDAFGFYNKLAEYDAGNPALQDYINQSLLAATIHILFDVDAWDFKYAWDIDRKFKNIEKESDGFVQVYFEENIPQVDCMMEVDFNDLDVSTRSESSIESFSKQIQDGYETVRDTSGVLSKVPVYKNIEGSVTITTEIKQYNWEVRAKANANSNYCDLRSKIFETAVTLERNLYKLSGDDRAIPSQYKDNRDEEFRDDEDDVVDDMIDDIYEQIVKYYF